MIFWLVLKLDFRRTTAKNGYVDVTAVLCTRAARVAIIARSGQAPHEQAPLNTYWMT
jgi:hypothetical protein